MVIVNTDGGFYDESKPDILCLFRIGHGIFIKTTSGKDFPFQDCKTEGVAREILDELLEYKIITLSPNAMIRGAAVIQLVDGTFTVKALT